MNKILAGIVAFGIAVCAWADAGWNNSYVFIWPGAGPDVYFDLNGSDQSQNFHGADLGTFSISGSLVLNSQLNAWVNSPDYYTDTSFSLFYRVYATGDAPPEYSSSQSVSIANTGGNNWQGYTPGVNILDGLSAGSYSLDVFAYKIHFWESGPESWEERIYQGGVNDQPFTASFDVIPEPGTLSLMGLGLAAVAGLRRRRR